MSLKNYLEKKKEALGWVSDIKGQERAIGILSYARKIVKKTEEILAPLREDLKILKRETPDEEWFIGLNDRIQIALAQAIDYAEWLTLPGCTADSFVLETDWSGDFSGYLLFARQNYLEKSLVDLGSKVAIKAASSYLGELDTIIWACKKTKSYRGDLPLLIRSDNHGVIDKSRAYEVYDQDIRSYRRWSWLIENEPGFKIEFLPGSENSGADLLSRPVKLREKKGALIKEVKEDVWDVQLVMDKEKVQEASDFIYIENDEEDTSYEDIGISSISQENKDLIWQKHLPAHWGAEKVFWMLKRRGVAIPLLKISEELLKCKTCAHFRKVRPRNFWRQPPYSLEPGHTVHMDFIGPVKMGRGGVKFILCVVDSCTRMGGAWKFRTTQSQNVIRGLQDWIFRYGLIKRIVSDNAAYFTSDEMKEWCAKKDIEQIFIAPYKHESNGLIERYNQTIEDRLRKMTFDQGGSWSDHLDAAVDLINSAPHKITGYIPKELWKAPLQDRIIAHKRSLDFRKKRNEKRKKFSPYPFTIGQHVLAFDAIAAMAKDNKFTPRWKGPYRIVEQVSTSLWRVKELGISRGRGRKPTLIFHQDHLQPFDIE